MFFKKKKLSLALCFALATSVTFAVEAEPNKLPLKEIGKIAEVYSIISNGYVDGADNSEVVINGLKGMVNGLDPYSTYLSKEEMEEFSDEVGGQSVGIGVVLSANDKGLQIETVFKNSAASKVNLESGDVIVSVKGNNVMEQYKKPFDAIKDIRGDEGTKVKLKVLRKSNNKIEHVEVTREKFDIPSVRVSLLDNEYGYIELTTFNENTAQQLKDELSKFEKGHSVKGYILDMRSNPGGILQSAIEISDYFLDKGVIVSTKGRYADDEEKTYATRGQLINKKPMVVMIDSGTASAAEIVAGALQDHERAMIVGQKSFGKGSVQTIIPLSGGDGDAIKLTIARYYTPTGRSIQAEGIVPDITVPKIENVKISDNKEHREEDNAGHIENDTDYKAKKKSNKKENDRVVTSSIEEDYDLYIATNTLKTLTFMNKGE